MAKKKKPAAPQEITAAEAGRLRWKGTTKAERSELMSQAAKKRAKSLTAEQRSEIAAKAVKARWAKKKKAAKGGS